MGRGKLPMEYIKNERARNRTFEKRKNGLKKKAHEFATLCDVPLCMIIYQGPNSDPDTVPTNRQDAISIINRYTSIPKLESAKRSLNLETVLVDRSSKKKRKAAGADHNPRQLQNNNTKLGNDDGSWLPVLDGCTKEELSGLANILHNKMEAVEKRIGILRATFNTTNININSGGFGSCGGSYYDPNVFMGGPEFYHPHGQWLHHPMADSDRFEPHQMQMGGHMMWYDNF